MLRDAPPLDHVRDRPFGRRRTATDGDGNKDLLVGDVNGSLNLFLNAGTDVSPLYSISTKLTLADMTTVDVGDYSRPVVGDFNFDQVKDVLLGNALGEVLLLAGAVPVVLGDMNGDFNVTVADVGLFVQALTDRPAYNAHLFPVNPDINGDVNQDGTFDTGDLGPLSALLGGPASANAVPEPSALMLSGLAMVLLAGSRRGRRR